METIILPAENPASIQTAMELLQEGEIVAFPTDTVYGLGANAFYSPGIIKLFEAKGRDANKAIAVLIGDISQLELLTEEMNETSKMLAKKFWPGALTLVVPKKKDLPELLTAGNSIGIRIPDHPIALALLRQFGPIATTSANLSGKSNPHDAKDVLKQLNKRIPLILDGGRCSGGIPSTVVDCTNDEVRILRPGAISQKDIDAALAETSD